MMIPLSTGIDYFSRPYHHKTVQEALRHAQLNLSNIKTFYKQAKTLKDASRRYYADEMLSEDRIHTYTIRECAMKLPINSPDDQKILQQILNICDKSLAIRL